MWLCVSASCVCVGMLVFLHCFVFWPDISCDIPISLCFVCASVCLTCRLFYRGGRDKEGSSEKEGGSEKDKGSQEKGGQ